MAITSAQLFRPVKFFKPGEKYQIIRNHGGRVEIGTYMRPSPLSGYAVFDIGGAEQEVFCGYVFKMPGASLDQFLFDKTPVMGPIPMPPADEEEDPDMCPDCKVPGDNYRMGCRCPKCNRIIWGC